MMKNVRSINGVSVTNKDFLVAIFDHEWEKVHVTSFSDDPINIDQDRRDICWGGGSARRLLNDMAYAENQYFCISLFNSPRGFSYRRKNIFDACFVIVADDVEEKLPVKRVEQLPEPSYKLVTSEGSEQWGWILSEPCEDRNMVENLLDGLVAKGLAPDGTDPGMKGVTRYVRLPEGSNTKEKKRDEKGNPFKCYMKEWNPSRHFSMAELANVFGINLYQERSNNTTLGENLSSDKVKNHPLIKSGVLNITGEGNDNWIRCDCPNAANHTGGDPSGAALQIKEDGAVMFQCHHGHCNGDKGKKLTGVRLIALLDDQHGLNLKEQIKEYKKEILVNGTRKLMELGVVNELQPKESKKAKKHSEGGFDPNDWVYITQLNRFYRISSGAEISPKALDSLYKKEYQNIPVSTVFFMAMDRNKHTADGYAWVPTPYGKAHYPLVKHEGMTYVNQWMGFALTPMNGDVSPWLQLIESVIPEPEYRSAVLWWLAHKVQKPEVKVQWQILMMGEKGIGKDSMLRPIMQIFGNAAGDVSAENMEAGWGDYFAKKAIVSVQEVYREQDKKFSNMIKNFAASTSTGMKQYNLKGGKIVTQPDALSLFIFSNHRHCIALEQNERRYLVLENWEKAGDAESFKEYHNWLDHDNGAAKIFDYLLNYDLTGYTAGQLPYKTSAYYDLVEGGKADYETVIEEMIDNREGVFAAPHFMLRTLMRQLKDAGHKMGQKGVIRTIEKAGYNKYRGTKKEDGVSVNTPRFYTNRDLSQLTPTDIFDFYQGE